MRDMACVAQLLARTLEGAREAHPPAFPSTRQRSQPPSASRSPPQDGLRVTYFWIKEQLEREAKEQGKDLRWAQGLPGVSGGKLARRAGLAGCGV